MDLYRLELMTRPSCMPGYCVVCGRPYPTEHHVIPRAAGGEAGPRLHLCGHGTIGCHGKAEARRLHFRHDGDRWLWVETTYPLRYGDALELEGWRPVSDATISTC